MFSSFVRTAASRAAPSALNKTRAPASSLYYHLRRQTFASSTFLPSSEVTERVMEVMKNFDKVDPSKVTESAKFSDDLGLDSLDSVEVLLAVEDEFCVEIPDAEADKMASIADVVEYVTAHPMAK